MNQHARNPPSATRPISALRLTTKWTSHQPPDAPWPNIYNGIATANREHHILETLNRRG
ncbi:hypothetical protein CGRA01v4_07512 [Colletotrichum graminicola]|nr:hypothetical protein CGRA01v4_07512 [Colletotrichum graminicola]